MGQAVGVGVCVGGIGLLFDISGAPPRDGATYTPQHTAAHCNTLQHTATHVAQYNANMDFSLSCYKLDEVTKNDFSLLLPTPSSRYISVYFQIKSAVLLDAAL